MADRSVTRGFCMASGRFLNSWLMYLGLSYLLGIPLSERSLIAAAAPAALSMLTGFLIGDVYWGWRGLMERKETALS